MLQIYIYTHTHPFPFHTPWVSYTHIPCHTGTHPSLSLLHTLVQLTHRALISPVIHPPSLVAHAPSDVTVAHLHVSHPATASLESHPHPFLVTYPHQLLLVPPHPRHACVTHTELPSLIHTASHGSHPELAHSASPTHPLACHTHTLSLMCHTATAPSRLTCTHFPLPHEPL